MKHDSNAGSTDSAKLDIVEPNDVIDLKKRGGAGSLGFDRTMELACFTSDLSSRPGSNLGNSCVLQGTIAAYDRYLAKEEYFIKAYFKTAYPGKSIPPVHLCR